MAKIVPDKIVQSIKELRKKGFSFSEIRRKLNVSHGTIFRHTRDLQVLPQYQKIWEAKRSSSVKRKEKAEKEALLKAQNLIKSLSKKEKIILLTALYWGEGSKLDFGLSNTDPELIRVFLKGLKEAFDIPSENIKASIRIYEDLNKDKCLKYWASITDIPSSQFVSINTLKGKKNGKLPYGMCRIRIRKGGNMLKYMNALKNEITRLF